jgi:hypothetical protein
MRLCAGISMTFHDVYIHWHTTALLNKHTRLLSNITPRLPLQFLCNEWDKFRTWRWGWGSSSGASFDYHQVSYSIVNSLIQCFRNRVPREPRVPRNIVRDSAKNRDYIQIIVKIPNILEISREFLSGNCQYWSNLRALPTASFVFSPVNVVIGRRSSGYEKLF